MRKRWIGALLAGILLLGACGGGEGDADAGGDADGGGDGAAADGETPTISLGAIPTSGLTIGHVLDENPDELDLTGRGEDYELDMTYFSGSPDVVQGVAGGTLDGGAVGATAIFPLFDQGVDVRIVGEYFEERSDYLSPSYLVREDSDIETAADMEGRTVATNSVGSPIYWTAVGYFRSEAGLEPDQDYTVLAVPFPNMLDALDEGEVDAAPVIQPWLQPALDSGDYRALFSDTDVQDPYVQSLLVLRGDVMDEHPDAVEAFLADWGAAAEFVNDEANHDAVVEAVSAVTDVPAENLGYVATEDHYYFPERGAPNEEAIQQNWDWFHEVGGIDETYDVTDYIDPEFTP